MKKQPIHSNIILPVVLSRLQGKICQDYPLREFHLRASVRQLLQVPDRLFGIKGNIIFANFFAARKLAQQLNEQPQLLPGHQPIARASHLNAMGLIDEILHHVVHLYRSQVNPDVMKRAWSFLTAHFSENELHQMLILFLKEYPPTPVFHGAISPEKYLKGRTQGIPNRDLVLEELIMTWLDNENPAYKSYRSLFDDTLLRQTTVYPRVIKQLHRFFQKEPPFGPDNQPLLEMLQTPARMSPHSLKGQLAFIRQRWGLLLADFLFRLMGGSDFLKEEEKLRPPPGPGPTEVPVYPIEEPEHYSPDRDWMPRLVLIAKSTLVWLDQLSRKYGHQIRLLSDVPDEELDQLAAWGFTGLWLIGIWQRSAASKKIKQLCGNPEAEASAYALFDYVVSPQLGGEAALTDLQQRCWQRGIRLASDMVPNHTGIDARWVIDHPDWFIQTPSPPFPNYTFNGPNLSDLPHIGIYIEDHYYDKSDAAVVFKRVDFRNGEVRYIYHGNDGTSIPWNDTAQLNYLLPEVREAVIQKILEVARRFPIIRFDAAMTLTKKHFQRLWFPEPGQGGDIPSRAEFAMKKEEFDLHMPNEFWREVVDRVAQEAPDTLLLAEAFWLMESYFVRTLGMHRVYNSAFMHMLKNEENAKYRELLKNTLAYDPQILKRYVNFMNNPDEETAVVQFGKGDKYFGVCTLMVTLPGLPMFGHGQVEGFREKYGMEYHRAYLDEVPDAELIARHEREIFPLMRMRHRFADVTHFQLYDVVNDNGEVQESILAYSNGNPGEETLVVYNNRLQPAAGWLRFSVPRAEKTAGGNSRQQSMPIAEALRIQRRADMFTIFKDHISGLYFIRNNMELHEQGLYISLKGYEYHVFLEFQQVADNQCHHFAELHRKLAGEGVPDIQQAIQEILYRGIRPYGKELMAAFASAARYPWEMDFPENFPWQNLLRNIIMELQEIGQQSLNEKTILQEIYLHFKAWQQLSALRIHLKGTKVRKAITALKFLETVGREQSRAVWLVLLLESVLTPLRAVLPYHSMQESWEFLLDVLDLPQAMNEELPAQGYATEAIEEGQALLPIVAALPILNRGENLSETYYHQQLLQLLDNPDIQHYLKVNEYQGNIWFNKERYETLLLVMFFRTIVQRLTVQLSLNELARQIKQDYRLVESWLKAEQASGYLLAKLKQFLQRLL